MLYRIRQRNRKYEIYDPETGRIHARRATKGKAQAQIRLLRGLRRGGRR